MVRSHVMGSRAVRAAAAVQLMLLAVACSRGPAPPASPSPQTAPTRSVGPLRLTEHDVQVYLAVRNRALQRQEEELDRLLSGGASADVLKSISDFSAAEREAARSLGVDWTHYRWIRQEIGRLLSEQRHQEDSRLLALELARARDDLAAQLKQVRDEASRQFLQAQLASLDAKLARIQEDQNLPEAEAGELKLVEAARAELALLQGRQDRMQHRVRELLQKTHEEATPAPRPAGK